MKHFIRSVFLCAPIWLCALCACAVTGLSESADEISSDSLAAVATERARANDVGAAMLLYRSALESDPAHAPSLRGMADIASRSGDAVTTAHYYGRLRESGALQVDDVLTLAGVQKRSGQTHEAIGTLESGTNPQQLHIDAAGAGAASGGERFCCPPKPQCAKIVLIL